MSFSNAISSPGLEVGPTQLVLLGGQTTENYGPVPVRVSRSHLLGASRVSTIHGTYGPTSFLSSVPEGPLSLWESKLRKRLAMRGSTEWDLTWKVKTTPGGRVISRLAASTPRTSEIAYIGWPTPDASVFQDGEKPKTWLARREKLKLEKKNGNGCGIPLAMAVQPEICGRGTLTVRDHKDASSDLTNTPVNGLLGRQALTAGWNTPTALSPAKDGYNEAGNSCGLVSIRKQVLASGTNGNSSDQIQTENTGALNPEFVLWLQGYPPEYLSCVDWETVSSRKRRSK